MAYSHSALKEWRVICSANLWGASFQQSSQGRWLFFLWLGTQDANGFWRSCAQTLWEEEMKRLAGERRLANFGEKTN